MKSERIANNAWSTLLYLSKVRHSHCHHQHPLQWVEQPSLICQSKDTRSSSHETDNRRHSG